MRGRFLACAGDSQGAPRNQSVRLNIAACAAETHWAPEEHPRLPRTRLESGVWSLESGVWSLECVVLI